MLGSITIALMEFLDFLFLLGCECGPASDRQVLFAKLFIPAEVALLAVSIAGSVLACKRAGSTVHTTIAVLQLLSCVFMLVVAIVSLSTEAGMTITAAFAIAVSICFGVPATVVLFVLGAERRKC